MLSVLGIVKNTQMLIVVVATVILTSTPAGLSTGYDLICKCMGLHKLPTDYPISGLVEGKPPKTDAETFLDDTPICQV